MQLFNFTLIVMKKYWGVLGRSGERGCVEGGLLREMSKSRSNGLGEKGWWLGQGT